MQVLQQLPELEMTMHLEADQYQRTRKRKGYGNGYKPRQLKTRVGRLGLRLPQDRAGTFTTELCERYQRSEKALVRSLKPVCARQLDPQGQGHHRGALWQLIE